MRILIATTSGGLEDSISSVFGRSPTYTLVEIEGNKIKNVEVLPNPFADSFRGAGIRAGQFAIDKGVNVVVAGNFGPNAAQILQKAGIEMLILQGKVKDAIERYIEKEGRDDIKMLEEEIRRIEDMLQEIKRKIEDIESKK
ncbi:MAG: NifB/NifX family molybdenum-iron cluster-binding protein [Thermoplasmatales archaeon]|nr:NifB/NifX family molybdenum-iron cluster-binding protein [Thermoplasmatales archaeon]